LLPVLLYSLCLYDAIIALACSGWAIRVRQILTLRTALLLQALVLTGLFYLLAGHWCKPLTTWRFYASLPPLGLRGATLLHLPKDKAEDYRDLTGYLKAECDAFITIPGMNSLYFWTDKSPPTYFIIAEVVLLSEAQQAEVVAALQKSRRSLIVLTKIRSPSVKGPLGQLIATSTEIKTIGGVRPDALKWHPMGMAIDVMIPNYQTTAGKELGDRIAAFALANADRLSLNHVIWRRVMYSRTGKPYLMPNQGGDDANHYTHVHIATNGGGYPNGTEIYVG